MSKEGRSRWYLQLGIFRDPFCFAKCQVEGPMVGLEQGLQLRGLASWNVMTKFYPCPRNSMLWVVVGQG